MGTIKMICYLPLGYPTLEKSVEMAGYYVQGGCDAIEVSIPPVNPYRDGPFIQDLMRKALEKCGSYERYLEKVRTLTEKYPGTEFFLLLYHEVIMNIGVERLCGFCKENGIENIISGDLHDEGALAILRANGIKLARAVNYQMKEDDIKRCIETDGFTYMQAFLSGGQQARPGFEELKTCIRYLRERRVSEPIYCGAGIRNPGDAARVKEAGGDGFFVGSSIIKLYENPQELVKLIEEYKRAVTDEDAGDVNTKHTKL